MRTLGHSTGDKLLKAVAERVSGALPENVSIARVGGDEFGVAIGQFESRDEIADIARQIIRSMDAPYLIGGSEILTSASIGISIYRVEMTGPEEVMREADLALYEAKDTGREHYAFYSEAHEGAVRERVLLFQEFREAIARNQFEVFYQPQVEWPSGRIIGLEALLRWNHPRRGLVTPGAFISVAEKTGSITPLGRWVLSNVCEQLRLWRREGVSPPVVAINVSAAQLVSPSEFDRDLAHELSIGGLHPEMLELELTELVLVNSPRGQADAIDRLRRLGVRIAIDDFGTGYSSFEYLLSYRVNRIKIARQFVCGLPRDPVSATIVRATIGLAREFGFEIIAEGVEAAEQLDFLVKSGCKNIQGFYFSRPVPADQACNLLRQGGLSPEAERRCGAIAECEPSSSLVL